MSSLGKSAARRHLIGLHQGGLATVTVWLYCLLTGFHPIVVVAECVDDKHCNSAQSFPGLRLKFHEAEISKAAESPSAVLSTDVFYGRPLLRIPKSALLTPSEDVRQQVLDRFEEAGKSATSKGPKLCIERFKGEAEQLAALSLSLILEKRSASSPFRHSLDALSEEEPPLALSLSERQQKILIGTTVENAQAEMIWLRDEVLELSRKIKDFAGKDASEAEANWALGVVLKRSHQVQSRELTSLGVPWHITLPLLPELLKIQWHPDPAVAPPLIETTSKIKEKVEEVLLRIAGQDFSAGKEIFVWSGRLSNSELVVRGFKNIFSSRASNPTGVGGNLSEPETWNPSPKTRNFQHFKKYNCTSNEVMEIRLSPKGWPMRSFVRCYRVAYHMASGFTEAFSQYATMLDKWPPLRKYKHEDWLAWTQADQMVNRIIIDYCAFMRERLRDALTLAEAEEFRKSTHPLEKLLWKVRSEESVSFKECISVAKGAIQGTKVDQ